MSIRIEVPAGGSLFEGHFPGRPILPGVALLAMVVRALAPPEGVGTIRAIPFLRFRSLVFPGDVLTVRVRPSAGEAVCFDLQRENSVVANGAIVFGQPIGAEDLPAIMPSQPPQGLPGIDELLPHRPPMRFIEKIVDETGDGITCLGRVPLQCALVSRRVAPSLAALEAAAQTAAIWEALRRWRECAVPEARVGYLVLVREVTCHRGTIPADTDLFASIRLSAHAAPLSTYAVEVMTEGAVTLRGTIGTYLTDG